MKKFQWVAYGLDMFGYVVFETEGYSINEAHSKAVKLFKEKGFDFDTIEPFDKAFASRMKWFDI